MVYKIIWSPKSKEGLYDLEKDIQRRIIKKVEELKLAPYHFIERLTGTVSWKLRIGDYRTLIDMDEKKKEIRILKVGHRKNIYK